MDRQNLNIREVRQYPCPDYSCLNSSDDGQGNYCVRCYFCGDTPIGKSQTCKRKKVEQRMREHIGSKKHKLNKQRFLPDPPQDAIPPTPPATPEDQLDLLEEYEIEHYPQEGKFKKELIYQFLKCDCLIFRDFKRCKWGECSE